MYEGQLEDKLASAHSFDGLLDELLIFLKWCSGRKSLIHLHIGIDFARATRTSIGVSIRGFTLLSAHYHLPSYGVVEAINWKGVSSFLFLCK